MWLHHGCAPKLTWTGSQINFIYITGVSAPWYAVNGYTAPPLAWYPPVFEGNFQEFGLVTNLSGVLLHYRVLHKSISYIYKVFLHLDKLWMRILWHHPQPDTPTESRVNFQEFWGGGRPIWWCDFIMVEPQTPLGVLHKSISYIYKVFLHLDKLGMGIWHHP